MPQTERSTLFPYTTLFRSLPVLQFASLKSDEARAAMKKLNADIGIMAFVLQMSAFNFFIAARDRKSTRLNSSHSQISYAVFCLKKKKTKKSQHTINTKIKT